MIYTCRTSYSATGEGVTISVLVGTFDSKIGAIEAFARAFGPQSLPWLEVREGIDLDFDFYDYVLSEAVKNALRKHEENGTSFRYQASYHVNY